MPKKNLQFENLQKPAETVFTEVQAQVCHSVISVGNPLSFMHLKWKLDKLYFSQQNAE